MKYFLCIILLIGLGTCIVSCEKEALPTLSYEQDIAPLMTTCANVYCHAVGNYPGALKNYDEVVQVVNSGRLIPAIRHESGYSPMPKGGEKWSDENIELFEEWVAQGMPE